MGTYEDVLPAQIPGGGNRRSRHTSLIVGHRGRCAMTHLTVSGVGEGRGEEKLAGGRALRPIYTTVT